MELTSLAFDQNGRIPVVSTCDGENVSPPLSWQGIPEGTQSLVLIVQDPDAPNKTWLHWTVWNIDPSITEMAEGETPPGSIEGTTDFGTIGYGGPCPPSGEHRYFFKLFALDTRLDLPPGASLDELEDAIGDHVLTTAELVGLYGRGG